LRVDGDLESPLALYPVFFDRLQEGLVQGLKSDVLALGEIRPDLVGEYDEALDASGGEDDLAGRDPSLAAICSNEDYQAVPLKVPASMALTCMRLCGGNGSIMGLAVSP
jgi:hypothetical protein